MQLLRVVGDLEEPLGQFALLDDGAIVSVLNPAMLLGRTRASPAPKASTAATRIVVADDSLTSRAAVKTMLEIAGYTVVPACDGEDAWSQLARGGVDLVVSDVGLPDATGYDLMRELRARMPIRGIAISGWGRPEDIAKSREAGFSEHLTKPVGLQKLEQAIGRVWASTGSRSA